ncbi:unnamed protein product [Withania somnifera]
MDQWKKLCILGAGTYGKVYYGIKIHSSSLSAYSSLSLQQEAQILTTLKGCPYVVRFFGADVSIDGNTPTYNLFLEYACGGSLHDWIIHSKKGMKKMSELEIGFYAYQLLKGIQHIHEKGWVHCDIKPANILVFNNAGRGGMHKLKLGDFGLSLRIDDGMAYMTGYPLSNRGTPLYAPPESLTYGFHSKAYTHRCPHIYEIAGDFLDKCFVKDPRRGWTSKRLLQHPFIQQALCTSMPKTQVVTEKVNPFGCQIPIPEKDFINALFDTSLDMQLMGISKFSEP